MGRKHRNIERHYNKWGYIFMIPFVAAFMFFHFYPLANTVYYAFCEMKGMGSNEPQTLISLGEPWYRNFTDVLKTRTFSDALRNTLIIWVAYAVPELTFTFWLAAVITDRRLRIKGRLLYKTAFFFPKLVDGTNVSFVLTTHLVSTVGSTMVFVISAVMMNGFGFKPDDFNFFLSDRFFIIILSIYCHFGITFIYVIAGITGVPVEVMEAAEIDGATRTQTFLRVTLPCMRPILFFITVITVVDGVGMYKVPSLVTNNFDIFRTNLTLMMYLQNQFFMGNFAYDRASASSLIMLALYAFFAGLIYFIFIRDREEARRRRKIRKIRREERKRLKTA